MSYINVQIDTDNLDTDDMIDIIERRGYSVIMPDETYETVEELDHTLDEIHNLYHAFCVWKDGDKNERFENELKRFFLETVDIKVI